MAIKHTKKAKKNISVGKRKTAVARAHLKEGSGKIFINHVPVEHLTPKIVKDIILEPIIVGKEIADTFLKDKDIFVSVYGGGVMGQAQACRTAIGQLLIESLPSSDARKIRNIYNEYGRYLFISDVRNKQPRHAGYKARARKQQKSYR